MLSLAVATLIFVQPFLPLQSTVAAQKKLKGETVTPSVAGTDSTIFINEILYDITGTDAGEFVEVAGPAGTNLTGWSIVLYNGEGTPVGRMYDTDALPTTIPSQQGGYGTVSVSYASNGIQNGSPDGIALVNNGTVVQFLCYEGTFTASDGPANGQTCTNIGVSQSGSNAAGTSLQLQGSGTKYGDFTWNATSIANTKDAPNTGQTFTGGPPVDNPPTVTSTSPANNATGVAVNSNISVTFSEAVTATANSFQISCATSGTHAFTLSGGPTTYTLDPTTDFTQGEVCTVTVVAAQVTDQDGTPDQMAANYVFSFTVINTAPVAIHDIQGSGATSPFAGQTVTTSGIVTLLRTGANTGNGAASGFFLQAPTAMADADPNTSEGIFVFTSSVPTVGVGDNVTVTGTVVEFNGMTEISPVSNVAVNSTGNDLPQAVTLTTTILDPTAAPTKPQLEKYEGMRMFASSLTSVSPNDNFYDVDVVITGVPRPLREPGIEISLPVPPDPTSGQVDCCIARWDENPERLSLDTNGRAGAPNAPYTSKVVFTNVAGPLDYAFGEYRLIPESGPANSGNISATPVPTPTANEFTVGGFNVENFNNDPTQRQKAAAAIRDVMRLPDIIGMVEIFELTGLQALAAEVNAISPGANYQAYLVEADGNPGDADQDVGYLVNAARVQVDSVVQIEKAGCNGQPANCNTYIDPTTGQPALLNDRPPLVLRAHVQPSGANVPVIAVVNHLRSFINIGQDPGEGPRVRAKRKAQGEFLATLLQDLQTNNAGTSVISVGDYNAYQFSDGYTDPIATIKGNPTPDDQIVVDQSPDLVNPDFFNLVDELPAEERYSFNFEGTLQALDHVIINNVAHARRTRFAIARNNSDFPDDPASAYRTNAARPERNSDHDMPVAYFALSGPVAQAGAVLISEFRFNGPNGTGDEFIELYNNSNADVNLNGWSIVAPAGTGGGGVLGILSGTIAPRQHYLVAPSTYSVNGYPAGVGTTATPDAAYTGGAFLDDGGARLIDLNGTVIDAVGFGSANGTNFREGAGLLPAGGLAPGANDQYSFVRKLASGVPQDTNDNAADFVLVSTTGIVGGGTAVLGAPGPENTQSPIQSNATVKASLIDNCSSIGVAGSGCQNRMRDGSAGVSNPTNAQYGTLSFRRKFTNTTQQNVTRLRFRVVDITTLNSPGYAPNNGQADMRVLSSTTTTVTPSNPFTPGDVVVNGTTLEQPPTQTLGGGLNSTLTLNLSQPLVGGDSITVQLLVGIQQNGSYRFFVNVEADFDDPIPPSKAQATSKPRATR
ncbi:MAG TPA: lamin tail domain-containing protein [Pyrinomonadaceae bacterium]